MSSCRSRVCPACQTRPIMPFDLHGRCESCLGPEYAGDSLTLQAVNPYCQPAAAHASLRGSLLVLHFPWEGPELANDMLDAISSTTSQPTIRSLLRVLPGIIAKAAASNNLPVPPAQGPASAPRDPVWPRFPAIKAYQSGAAAEPGKLKAPVSTYAHITKVENFSEHGFPPVPPLEPRLAAMFGFSVNPLGGRRATPLSARDQMITRLSDRSHQCAVQASAAANNIALLASYLSKLATEPDLLNIERAEELGYATSAILTLCTSVAVTTSRIAAWQTMNHRQVWLGVFPLPNDLKEKLLNAPISLDGLFGPQHQSAVDYMQKTLDEAERIRMHMARSRAATRPQRFDDHLHRYRRDRRQTQGRPDAAASRPPAPRASLPAAQQAPRTGN
ncbi:unnamed protein product [Pleuronectes platessa]|uniref:Uncharacterized protein n=1 Tax=Pleuronectes platessa TaxID=8262 RepID=A0A9N7YD62_PLEPL|nr:unnamed protein product [Pleuronectes platessa]